MTKKTIEWIKPSESAQNQILAADGFYISYCATAGASNEAAPPLEEAIGNFVQTLGGMINGELEPQEETALCIKSNGTKWCILKGDFRKDYEAAYPDLDACLAVYNRHKAQHRSNWSLDDD